MIYIPKNDGSNDIHLAFEPVTMEKAQFIRSSPSTIL